MCENNRNGKKEEYGAITFNIYLEQKDRETHCKLREKDEQRHDEARSFFNEGNQASARKDPFADWSKTIAISSSSYLETPIKNLTTYGAWSE